MQADWIAAKHRRLAVAGDAIGLVGDARPAWLAAAHDALGRAVWDANGWDDLDPEATTEEDILGRLLPLNRERAGFRPSDQSPRPEPLPR